MPELKAQQIELGTRVCTDLAELARSLAVEPDAGAIISASARNRFTGIVTRVVKDTVMAQVELQAGPHRVVALLSREAVDELADRWGTTLAAHAVPAARVRRLSPISSIVLTKRTPIGWFLGFAIAFAFLMLLDVKV